MPTVPCTRVRIRTVIVLDDVLCFRLTKEQDEFRSATYQHFRQYFVSRRYVADSTSRAPQDVKMNAPTCAQVGS